METFTMVTRYFMALAIILNCTVAQASHDPASNIGSRPFSFDDQKKLAKITVIDELYKQTNCNAGIDISPFKQPGTVMVTPRKLSELAKESRELLSSSDISEDQKKRFANNYRILHGLRKTSISEDYSFKRSKKTYRKIGESNEIRQQKNEEARKYLATKEDVYEQFGIRNHLPYTEAPDVMMAENDSKRSSLSCSLPIVLSDGANNVPAGNPLRTVANGGVTKPRRTRHAQSAPTLPTTNKKN
jgi:hypothetical protein